MAVNPRIVQLSSKLEATGWDGLLIVVEANQEGWRGALDSMCQALEAHAQGREVILIMEEEDPDGAKGAGTRNHVRGVLLNSANFEGIKTYSDLRDALAVY